MNYKYHVQKRAAELAAQFFTTLTDLNDNNKNGNNTINKLSVRIHPLQM